MECFVLEIQLRNCVPNADIKKRSMAYAVVPITSVKWNSAEYRIKVERWTKALLE